MKEVTTIRDDAGRFRQDVIDRLRGRVREAIELTIEEELTELLGGERNEDRRGYRNGAQKRSVTTSIGQRTPQLPRARIAADDGTMREFRSELLPRYARRTREIDDAILGVYLAGANSRRIRKALEPMLGSANVSKSAVSRIVGRLKAFFEALSGRDLTTERHEVLYLDGFHLKVRLARRVVSVPVLAVLGVAGDGTKVLVSLRLAAREAASQWSAVLVELQKRGLSVPLVIVVDGHAGLQTALAEWPDVQVQRCARHKLVNLQEHCPTDARAEVKPDYRKIINATEGIATRKAYDAFVAKWSRLCPAVARSIEEAGQELLTFYTFPKAMWRALSTTNPLENLNREFRRRTKTQASFGREEAAVTLPYALVAFGQIRTHKIDRHRELKALVAKRNVRAA